MNDSHAGYAHMFKALSDETRLSIICRLRGGEELCACNILESLSITQPTLSHHMKTLTESGLVSSRKDANWMRYTLNRERLHEIQLFLNYLETEKNGESSKCDC